LLGWTDKLMHGLKIATSFRLTLGAPFGASAPPAAAALPIAMMAGLEFRRNLAPLPEYLPEYSTRRERDLLTACLQEV
jgi:hypothetical protein